MKETLKLTSFSYFFCLTQWIAFVAHFRFFDLERYIFREDNINRYKILCVITFHIVQSDLRK